MKEDKTYPSWTLFFSWGGFVFLSINFFTGILLSKISLSMFVFGNIISFILIALTLYPTVYISIKYKVNFSEAIGKFVQYRYIKMFLLFLILIVNIGWYSIQLTAVYSLLDDYLLYSSIILFFISYLFAYGSYKFEYEWLKVFSIFVLIFFIIYLMLILNNQKINLEYFNKETLQISFINICLMLYGTWAFSSSTIVMDISKYTNDFKSSYFYILMAMLVFNFMLIWLGYLFGKFTNIHTFKEFVSLLGVSTGLLLFVLNIWTTNDSNFFSSMQILKFFNFDKKIIFIVLPLISYLLAIYYKDNLFNIIGSWLKIMSWIAIPLTMFWWYILKKQYTGAKI